MPTDHIHIDRLRIRCIVGLDDEERREKQDVLISVWLETDLSRPGLTDSLDGALNYRVLKKKILAAVEASQFHLIEALAQMVVELCLREPMVFGVRVRVSKPGALRFARNVSVEMTRRRPSRAFIGVGSNLQPEKHLTEAVRRLARQVRIRGVSTVYQTPPVDRPDQPDYYNCVIAIETDLAPIGLQTSVLRPIENDLGRKRCGDKSAARTIDLDLLAFDDGQGRDGGLAPDPQIRDYAFFAAGVYELAPEWAAMVLGLPVQQWVNPGALSLTPLPGVTAALRALVTHSRDSVDLRQTRAAGEKG